MAELEPLIQYIIVIKAAIKGFSKGAISANVAHASVACLHRNSESINVKLYLKDLDSMRKCVLEIDNIDLITPLLSAIDEAPEPITYYKWVEMPEGIVTAVALSPCRKKDVTHLLGHLKLMR